MQTPRKHFTVLPFLCPSCGRETMLWEHIANCRKKGGVTK